MTQSKEKGETAPPPAENFLDMPDTQSHLASLLLSCQPTPQPTTRPKTFRPEPPSALLSRVAAFLPQLSAANATLQSEIERDAEQREQVDIENVGDDEQYIEMSLGVGVFDTQPVDGERTDERKSEKDIIMTTQSPVDEDSKPLIQVVSDTRSSTEEDDSSEEEADEDESEDEDRMKE
ncbi:hypothetical protein PhCBS80983_g01541 [Powellomyces hirtus]|uniref:Uncharacterized protein n=1 Tax=Powellomyces hirtus TaxID=109895 RepID=A0A507EBU5_9FUNG|nr:hypothetical protein PhCBS80983_g01541 [Powellomyces hirtus]